MGEEGGRRLYRALSNWVSADMMNGKRWGSGGAREDIN